MKILYLKEFENESWENLDFFDDSEVSVDDNYEGKNFFY